MKAKINLFLVGLLCGLCHPGSSFGAAYEWFSIGPTPIQDPGGIINNAPGGDTFGRVTAIAVDPSDGSHWLLGAAQGGIWQSFNGGDDWAPVADDAPSLAIGAITFAPGSPLVVYAGTGEGNFSADCYAGMGLLKSTNGGNSWSLQAGAPFAQTAFSAIKVNSANSDYLVVATVHGVLGRVEHGTNIPPLAPPRGVFLSHDGGTSWTQTLTGEATDVDVDPGNFNHQYAALGNDFGAPANGVYRSTDGGMSWNLITGPWTTLAATNLGRIRVAIAPSNPNRVYVSVAHASPVDFLYGLYRTDDAWDPTPTWTDVSAGLVGGPFPWYSQALLVHPSNPDVLYYAGHDVWRYDNSTGNWDDESSQHADQHALAWSPNSDHSVETMLVGHDGGLSSRVDDSGSWVSRGGVGKQLTITQFYRGAVHPSDNFPVLGGSQDNGTSIFNGGTPLGWNIVGGGDGYSCTVFDGPPFSKMMAISFQGLSILRTQDGINWLGASDGIDSENLFFGEFVMDPANNDVCLAGTFHLWLCPEFFSTWGPPQWFTNSPEDMFYPDGRPAQITAIAFAPSDVSANTYAYGGEDGELRLTVDAGAHWNNINAGGAVPGRYVSGLAFSPTDPNTLYVTLSGFNASTPGHSGHVFKTTDALAVIPTWTDVSPPVDQPMDCIAIDPTNPLNIFVGSDFGVWNSPDGAVTWAHQGTSMGLPNMAVFDLKFDLNGHLTAFTHGRGAYAYTQVPIIIPPECIPTCFLTWLNPGDLVEFTLPLWNEVDIPTGDLTATLRNTGQIVPLNGTQTQHYGSLSQSTGAVGRNFQFTAPISGGAAGGGGPGAPFPGPGTPGAASCGSIVYAIFDLADGGVSLGSISIPLHVGTLVQPLLQNFESAAMPALPPGWTSDAWNTTSNAPPNAFSSGDPDNLDSPGYLTGPVSISAFAPDSPNAAGNSLYSPVIPILTDQAELTFRQSFDLASNLDGGVLEISINGQPFTDIVTAGGSFTQNGYNATLAAGIGPLGGRQAWSAGSGGWLITDVTLPPQAFDQSVQFRWRLGAVSATGGDGWFIDDVSVNEYVCLPRLSISTGPSNTTVISWPDAYASWTLQQNTSVANPANWTTPPETIHDDGTNQYITVSPAIGIQFFRLRSP